ncbi:SDR family oxidoreductase [Photobacterium sp. CCB-ST2H9]|uniref:SDR family NAD(P)-dependent oxidoreductase n=1 Tax=Photobacterium sp. CCB-ST2H9 TaxID=2912855 RepID=UPI002004904D|nr:SDR family oxidoreductase [Photobacterium sp. CCB-ST2H9]UTM59857.1 SDR family oxidoreductase [Photobacterium sp. CCB-ST2H9]
MAQRIAIITGGSRGLGKNTALAMARKGIDIILTYRNKESEAASVVSEIQALGRNAVALQLDVERSLDFPDFAEQVKGTLNQHWQRDSFDILVNNAGIGIHASLMETTEAQFDQLFNIHLKGVFFLTQALVPLLKDGSRVVNISTGLTRFCIPGYGAYSAMKGAIEVYTRYLAKELGSRGIRVNVVAPGAIETDFGGGTVRDVSEVNDYLAAQTALGRVGLPDDIGGMIATLVAEENGWVTAQRIEASGGMFL